VVTLFAAFELGSRYWNTSFWVFVREIWKADSSRFDCRDSCSRSGIAPSRSSELAFMRLPSWQIWWEQLLWGGIYTKLKSDSSTRCCAISDPICIESWSTRWCFVAPETLFQAGSVSHSSCVSKVSCFFMPSEACLRIYWRGRDWKHPCDNETPPDNSPCTRLCLQYGTGTILPYHENTLSSWPSTGLLWRELFRFLKG